MFLKKSPIVSDDMADWIVECFDWFDDRFPVVPNPILPTQEFFRAKGGRGEAAAKEVLADVRRLLQHNEDIALIPLSNLPSDALAAAAGIFRSDDQRTVIQYEANLMNWPISFINTMAHELVRARLFGLEDDNPGGDGAQEYITDLACIISGFGVFQMQAAEEYYWTGDLSQRSRAYAFAVFLKRLDLGVGTVQNYLSPRPLRLLKRAMKQMA